MPKLPNAPSMTRIVLGAFQKVAAAVERGGLQAQQGIPTLWQGWLQCAGRHAFMPHPKPRAPASEETLARLESSLGGVLPAQLRELYALSDGVDWVVPPGEPVLALQGLFPPCASLRLAGKQDPPLSARCHTAWKEHEDPQLPRHVEVIAPSSWLTQEPEGVLTFEELDGFLALQAAQDSTALLMVHRPHPRFEVGMVLEHENLLLTRYASLAEWLSTRISMAAL